MDYLLCGNLPYPAWKKHISVQNLSNRRIRRYLVCRLKRPEARDFSHVRFTYVVAGERKRVIFITLFFVRQSIKINFDTLLLFQSLQRCHQCFLPWLSASSAGFSIIFSFCSLFACKSCAAFMLSWADTRAAVV